MKSDTKCARTACVSSNAVCMHTQTRRLYCPSCRHKINEHNPGLILSAQETAKLLAAAEKP